MSYAFTMIQLEIKGCIYSPIKNDSSFSSILFTLNYVGFLFKPKVKTHTWDERFQQLVAFKEKFGHCKVPRLYKGLGKWIADQRGKYNDLKAGKKTNLTNEKAQRLSDLGMCVYCNRRSLDK